ncbi:MAG: hypothetical protein IJM02_01565 [Clostridia bacterium]|nr:hypothetical protein [Clostridia bacterium]
MKTVKTITAMIICLTLAACLCLPALALDEADKTPVFDNVRTDLEIAYAGRESVSDKYVLAFASTPCGDPVGYTLYYNGEPVGDFTNEEPYVTLESPSGTYKIIAYNLTDKSLTAESGDITVKTEKVTFLVKLRYFFRALYLDTVIPGAVIISALHNLFNFG